MPWECTYTYTYTYTDSKERYSFRVSKEKK